MGKTNLCADTSDLLLSEVDLTDLHRPHGRSSWQRTLVGPAASCSAPVTTHTAHPQPETNRPVPILKNAPVAWNCGSPSLLVTSLYTYIDAGVIIWPLLFLVAQAALCCWHSPCSLCRVTTDGMPGNFPIVWICALCCFFKMSSSLLFLYPVNTNLAFLSPWAVL